jgi:electron transport complex protein RnfC
MAKTIFLDGKKESSLNPWSIKRLKYPARVFVPLRQTSQHSSIPCVKIGEHVRIGQKIAEPDHPNSVAVHASLSGQIKSIETRPHLLFGSSVCIEIESDEKLERYDFVGIEREGWGTLSEEQTLEQFQRDGLVEMSNDLLALHHKVERVKQYVIHTLVVDICEPEPYVTSDFSLTMSHPVEILKGAEILRQLAGAERVVLVIQDDKLEAAELLKSKIYFLKWENFEVEIIPSKYPTGLPIPMMKKVFNQDLTPTFVAVNRKKNKNNMALTDVFAEKGFVHHYVATAFAVYESIVMQKPLYERVVAFFFVCRKGAF